MQPVPDDVVFPSANCYRLPSSVHLKVWRYMFCISQERLMTLKKQASQITLQSQQERENFQREKNNLLIMLQKVRRWLILRTHSENVSFYSSDLCLLTFVGERETCIFGRKVRRVVWGAEHQQPRSHQWGTQYHSCETVHQQGALLHAHLHSYNVPDDENPFISVHSLMPLISTALAVTEGKEKKQQRKLYSHGWKLTSEEEPAAPHFVREIPGTDSFTQGS